MRRARVSALAVAVALVIAVLPKASACERTACWQCQNETACELVDGCVYTGHEEGEHFAASCVSEVAHKVWTEDDQHRCCDSAFDPCLAASLLGALGGLFAAALPCHALRYRGRQRYAELLSSPTATESKVKRTKAFVRTKWFEPAPGGKRGGRGRLHIEFIGVRASGEAFIVDAKIVVAQEFYDKVNPGQQFPVAYLIDDLRIFEVAPDASSGRSVHERTLVGCALQCLAGLGVLVAAASGLVTGCWLGYVPFFLLVVAGAALGHLFGWPLTRKWKQATSFVTVRQCAFPPAGDAAQLAPPPSEGPCSSMSSGSSSRRNGGGKDVSSTFASISPCAPTRGSSVSPPPPPT